MLPLAGLEELVNLSRPDSFPHILGFHLCLLGLVAPARLGETPRQVVKRHRQVGLVGGRGSRRQPAVHLHRLFDGGQALAEPARLGETTDRLLSDDARAGS